MKIERVRVFGFEPAFHGMRNPKESWDRSDSIFYRPPPDECPVCWGGYFTAEDPECKTCRFSQLCAMDGGVWKHLPTIIPERPEIGPKDMELACSLIKGGGEHRKFLRQIIIWVDITIPRYCWQELDTYKVATVRMSCSTMHKLGHRLLRQEDFEQPIEGTYLDDLNYLVDMFNYAQKNKDAKKLRETRRRLKNDLPEGYLQMATYMLSYETALAILKQRHNHRLDEWHWEVTGSICHWLLTLPYMREFAEAHLGALIVPDALTNNAAGEPGSGSPSSRGRQGSEPVEEDA